MSLTYHLLESSASALKFDGETARLLSFVAKSAPDQEFIASSAEHPVFLIQYLDHRKHYQQLSSHQAQNVVVHQRSNESSRELSATYTRIGGFDLDVTTTVRTHRESPEIRWNISIRNDSGIQIVDIQYPYLICSYALGGKAGSESILIPCDYGRLIRSPSPDVLGPDSPTAWQLEPHNGAFNHYPGGQFAQFLAYYNDRAGLYLACEDDEGNIKRFNALHRDPGFHLGVAHIGDWPRNGERILEYDIVTSSFSGDWYTAADMYRLWSLKQKWGTPLHRRKDVPEWLLESPPYITIRPQGVVDAGPVAPIEEFLPYEKCVPLLEKISERVESPLVAVIMGWERGGSWVYPDCFPPIGGDASVREFAGLCRARNWHVGSFCNGTRWVVGHCWNDYNGWDYFEENGGERSVSRLPDGSMWQDTWDQRWRPSYVCCLDEALTGKIATDFVERLIGWGLESIQFFDQNCGATTFPCFSNAHGHPPVPGKWMTRAMERQMDEFARVAAAAGETGIIHSTEMTCNEYSLQHFQQSDSRLSPPGHRSGDNIVPIYQYLFHECVVLHGGMGHAPEPYHLQIRNAYNGVMGEIPGGVMTGDGSLLDKDTVNWAPWEPKVGDNDDALEMIRTVTALRRGRGRDFLVYGRMLRPARLDGVQMVEWDFEGKHNAIPAVFDAAWMAPDRRCAVALANWTSEDREVRVSDARLGEKISIHTSARKNTDRTESLQGEWASVTLPPLSIAILEGAKHA